ncbi:MAG TPA: hypothetical protein DEU67_05590 [Acidobacteria bacterium]|nr:hypothetical protein [Acidobacteriota bacterium]|tara:strand:+ start:377 stop:829 length:453 start_codon:yes stop_codon:yes gene_type:complete
MGNVFGSSEPEVAEATNESISLLHKEDRLEGTLEVAGKFLVESEVKGTVRCRTELTVGDSARIEGEVQATIVIVAGRVSGNVHGSDRVEILPSGVVEGDVHAPRLVIQLGGVLEGRCHMREQAKPATTGVEHQTRAVIAFASQEDGVTQT